MAIFKCKMCGGSLELDAAQSVATCKYCGTKQTLPKLNDDKKTNLYDRANHFRRNNEFDKAMAMYEQILNEDLTDAESYWSILLCRYGIEYVEDPATRMRVPTVNRAQFTSIFDDEDYKSALYYADEEQRAIYEAEAREINEIQKGILAISQKEEPFDVFICYKETDHNGRRTHDSVLAQELYYQLKQEGFKVFFSRITLEDKLGSAYEPYIFAALQSAKVMVVVGTRPEFFNAAWVRNEWSRYLALMKNGAKKTLIPAYRDMDPYDLPEEFSHLQAQDMSKLGFMQDLIRGIKKIVKADAPKQTTQTVVKETVVTGGNVNLTSLFKRMEMALEDGEFERADAFCEQILNQDAENARAYLGKLMAELQVKTEEDLQNCDESFDDHNHYQKAIRFADDKLKQTLTGYVEQIRVRNENERLDGIYRQAKNAMELAETEEAYREAANLFEWVSGYQDSTALAEQCMERAEIARKDTILAEAKYNMNEIDSVCVYESTIELLRSIAGWRDADELLLVCQQRLEDLQAEEEEACLEQARQAEIAAQNAKKRAKRGKIVALFAGTFLCVAIAAIVVMNTVIIPNKKYEEAVALMEAEDYKEAIAALEALNGYKDSEQLLLQIEEAVFQPAYSYYLQGNPVAAAKQLSAAGFASKAKAYAFVADGKYKEAVKQGLTDIVIPNGVTRIDSNVFFECTGLTSITIPNSVTRIDSNAFSYCTGLTSVTISENVKSIGEYAFFECSNFRIFF